MTKVRITPAVEAVLREFLADVDGEHFGWELMRSTRQSSGKLYPILYRLTETGILQRLPAVPNERSETAPPRVPYRIDPDAITDVRQAIAEADAARRASTRRGRRQPVLKPLRSGS